MSIYSKYKEPPIPAKHLWLEIDLEKIRFNTKRDIDYVNNIIIKYNPELYLTINNMYKVHMKNMKCYLKLDKSIDESSLPKIMKKVKKKK